MLQEESPKAVEAYEPYIRVNTKPGLFFKRWTFIESVNLSTDRITVRFNLPENSSDSSPFLVDMVAESREAGDVLAWARGGVSTDTPLIALLPDPGMNDVTLTIRLDGCIAFRHRFPAFRRMVG